MPNSISDELINRLPSNLGGSAHQSKLFYMPNSSSEEPIHQFPSKLGESAHQPQLSKAQIARNEFYKYQNHTMFQEEEEEEAESEAVQPNVSPSSQLHSNLGGSAHQSDQFFSEYESEIELHISLSGDVQPNVNLGESAHQPQLTEAQIAANYEINIALYFVQKYPHLALARDDKGGSLLYWLATNPSCFFSGSNLGFIERWIYKFVHVEIRNSQPHFLMVNMEDIPESILEGFPTLQPRSFATQVLQWLMRLLWKTIAELVPYVKKVRDAKFKHECAVELVKNVCTQLSSMSFQEIMEFLLLQNPEPIMPCAVTGGIEEIVKALFLHFPDLIDFPFMPKRNILQAAIEHRQVNIVNIIKEIFPIAAKNLSGYRLESGNTTLHLAGKLAPPFKLLSVSGAALQMQRELQWFKEVEKIVYPKQWEWKNTNKETPKDVFRRAHQKLAKDGEKWMKDTANSCMLVSALIATVLFAAAFTVPGGNKNDDKGIPVFLRTNTFIVFAISDALGLFSSLTSLLMFLAILTARYEIEDFLKSLPKKLIIGLGSLFVAIAAMIIAFGAALIIVLNERWHWVSVPITLLASFPVAIFVMLQLPLFVQIVQSTYGVSMFHPWPSRKFE